MRQVAKFRKRIANAKSNEFRMTMEEAKLLLAEIDSLITPAETPRPTPPPTDTPVVIQSMIDGGGFI